MSQTVSELMLGIESQPVTMCSVDLSQSVSDWE